MSELRERYRDQIVEVAEACRAVEAQGHVTAHGGNLSFRVDENVVLITPTMLAKGKVGCEDVVGIDMEGNILFAKKGLRPTGEKPIHLHLFRRRPDLRALIHAHSPAITALAIAHSDLLARPLLPEPMLEVGPVLPVAYKEPLTGELARAFDKVVGKTNAFLMLNHGVMVGSPVGISHAREMLDMLEAAAHSAIMAQMLGSVQELGRQEVAGLERTMKTNGTPMPGSPGVVKSLTSLFFGDSGQLAADKSEPVAANSILA